MQLEVMVNGGEKTVGDENALPVEITNLSTMGTDITVLTSGVTALSSGVTLLNTDVNLLTSAVTALTAALPGSPSVYRRITSATTNAASIKATAGKIKGFMVSSAAATIEYVKLFDAATAPTPGAGTPVMTIPVPALGMATAMFGEGIAFATGIGIDTTTGVADTDTGAVAAGDLIIHVLYS